MSDLKNNQKMVLFAATVAMLLLLAQAVRNGVEQTSAVSHAVSRSACGSTQHPDLCLSVISAAAGEIASRKDVIAALLDATSTAATRCLDVVRSVAVARSGVAVNVCLETIESAVEDLRDAAEGLRSYSEKKNIRRQGEDLNILISAALAYQETCLDGFSSEPSDSMVLDIFYDDLKHVERLCSMALAMIKNMTETDMAKSDSSTKLIKEVVETANEEDDVGDSWPWWLSEEDRRLLTSPEITPDVVVAADGSGDFAKVNDAVASVPRNNRRRYVIKIKEGVYNEIVNVTSGKRHVMFVGEGTTKTIITGNLSVGFTPNMSTFWSATVIARGNHFMARDITFENSAGPNAGQAVALRAGSDKAAFYRCNFSAYQDTLYVHSQRQFFVKCHVSGTIDFIFGDSAAILQDCDIGLRVPRPNGKNMVTAQSRIDENENTGIVIQNCRIHATPELLPIMGDVESYLGRPWRNFSRVVVMESYISDVIRPEGWHEWVGWESHTKTLTYIEYDNRGPGSDTTGRVDWDTFKVVYDPNEVKGFTAGEFLDGRSWLPETGFPFELGFINV